MTQRLSTLRIYPTEEYVRCIKRRLGLFIAVLFMITPNWQQPKGSAAEWLNCRIFTQRNTTVRTNKIKRTRMFTNLILKLRTREVSVKEHMLSESRYTKFKIRQRWSMREVRTGVPFKAVEGGISGVLECSLSWAGEFVHFVKIHQLYSSNLSLSVFHFNWEG